MHEYQRRIIELITGIMPDETFLPTSIKGLSLFRVEESFRRSPYSYNSEIIILAQGEKRVYLGSDIYTYDPSRYLVLP
ncbi:MAG: AraC family transcriptional regulator, partial [Rubrobacteridae bacterium]|nr:AraC family transcriptional regulator [Rubrobacteridae bacterium]